MPLVVDGVPPWFVGAWKREWIHRRGEVRGETRIVRDVQTTNVFGSVRIPLDRPTFAGARSLAELGDGELRVLADQDGFAGFTTCVGDVVTWHHQIAFQPPSGDDVGRLVQDGPTTVYEHALDDAYVERWESVGRGPELAIRVDGAVREILAVVGDHFVYARGRGVALPSAPSLASREQLLGLVDCELSYGRVAGWEVRHSTFPWAEGVRLPFVDRVVLVGDVPTVPGGICVVNTVCAADLRSWFG